jgi:AcrR family transcriptional regulator
MGYDRTEAISGDAADRILEVTERLFAEKGINVSLREITTMADVNLAAVSYYFGSKTKLAEALFDRLSRRVNSQRLEDLEAHIGAANAKGETPALEAIIRAFVRPYLDPSEKGRLLGRLIMQHRIEPSELTRTVIAKHFDPMASRFVEALRLACPHLTAEEVYWRYSFMIGSIVLTVTDLGPESRLGRLSSGSIDPTDKVRLEEHLVAFLLGGFRSSI